MDTIKQNFWIIEKINNIDLKVDPFEVYTVISIDKLSSPWVTLPFTSIVQL